MKVYDLRTLEDYKEFVKDAAEHDQPVYIYTSSENISLVLLSTKDVNDPDDEINKFIAKDNDSVDDDEPLFDFEDDGDILLMG